jgi:hypothetical protein
MQPGAANYRELVDTRDRLIQLLSVVKENKLIVNYLVNQRGYTQPEALGALKKGVRSLDIVPAEVDALILQRVVTEMKSEQQPTKATPK